MSYFKTVFKNEDYIISEDTRDNLPADRKGRYWLYDKYQGMNLAMGASTEREALIKALDYYKKEYIKYKTEYNTLKDKVDSFVLHFVKDDDDDWRN